MMLRLRKKKINKELGLATSKKVITGMTVQKYIDEAAR